MKAGFRQLTLPEKVPPARNSHLAPENPRRHELCDHSRLRQRALELNKVPTESTGRKGVLRSARSAKLPTFPSAPLLQSCAASSDRRSLSPFRQSRCQRDGMVLQPLAGRALCQYLSARTGVSSRGLAPSDEGGTGSVASVTSP